MTLPLMTPAQRDLQVAALERAAEILRALPVVTPCERCSFFSPDLGGRCGHWQAIVPEDHRAAGCEQFDELIPF